LGKERYMTLITEAIALYRHQYTTLYDSAKNGRVEVSNYIVCFMARSMLLHANPPAKL
jgi:hypothetical protein